MSPTNQEFKFEYEFTTTSSSSVKFEFKFTRTPLLIRLPIHTKMTSSSPSLPEKVATFASVTGVEDQSTSRRILKVYY